MEWAAKVICILPKGISLMHNGYPYEWVIQGFGRFAPLFKEKKKEKGNAKASPEDAEHCTRQRCGQIITMGIIAQTRQYNELIAQGGLTVFPTPSWDIIEFSPAADNMECMRHLALQGVTTTEVSDTSQYAYTWLEHSDDTEWDTQIHIFINTYQEQARHRPESQPWPDNLTYEYNSSFARWMLVLPATETTRSVASNPSASTIMGSTATLLLTRTGTPGLQPHNTAMPPATIIAGNTSAGDIPDENVNMEEPHDAEDASRVMETDTT
jgi:hypothetical protein